MLSYSPFDYACMKHVSLLLQRKWFASLLNLMNCNTNGKLPDAVQCLLQQERNHVLQMSKLLVCNTDLTVALKCQLQLTFCKDVPLNPDISPHYNYHTLRFISLWSKLRWTTSTQHPNLESLQIFRKLTNFVFISFSTVTWLMYIPWVLSEDSWLKRSRCSHEAACLAPSSTSQRVDWKGKKKKKPSSLYRYLVAKGRHPRCKRATRLCFLSLQ